MTKIICPNCKSKNIKITTTDLNLKRGSFETNIKGVPAQICGSCREVFIPGSVAEPISEFAENAFAKVTKARKALQPKPTAS